jgi:protein SCO1/2
MIGGLLRVLVVALVLLVAAMFLLPRGDRSPLAAATWLPDTLALPAVELVDDSGEAADLDAFRGRFSLLFFGFTNCPDVCPLTLKVLADARTELEKRAPKAVPQIVFVSVDPERDTPDRIAAYLGNFDRQFRGMTASDERLAPLLKALGVTVEKHRHGGEQYTVVHNSTVYFIGPAAELIAVASGPHDPTTIAADYLKIRQRYRSTHRTPAS